MTKPKPKGKKSTGVGASSSAVKNNEPVNPNEMAPRPGTASSVGRKVDELFQVSQTSTTVRDTCCKLPVSGHFRAPHADTSNKQALCTNGYVNTSLKWPPPCKAVTFYK